MKDEIIKLLAGNTLASYLSGIDLFEENIGTAALADDTLDQAIIERVCAVVILERWVEYPDYIASLEEIIDGLPSYSDLIPNEIVGQHIRGIALFVNGLAKGHVELSGFLNPSASGYMMSYVAADAIRDYLEEQGLSESGAFFTKTAAFFEQLSRRQYAVITALMKIEAWNSSIAIGFYNIMTASDMASQFWMLDSLYKVVNDPIVKVEIFDKYLSVLNTVRDKCVAEGAKAKIEQLDAIIKMVEHKSKGEQ